MAQRPASIASNEEIDIEEDDGYLHEDEVAEIFIDEDGEPIDEDNLEDGDLDDAEDIVEEIEPSEDTSILTFPTDSNFSGRRKSIFAVALHPTLPLAVSGSEDDTASIWDTITGQLKLHITGHSDSVVAVGFSSDGKWLVSGGMDGKIKAYTKVDGGVGWDWKGDLEGPDEVVFLRWHPTAPLLLAGSTDSTIWLYTFPASGEPHVLTVLSSHAGPITSGEFTPDGKRIVTSSSDGTVAFWDPRSSAPVWKIQLVTGETEAGVISLAVNSSGTIVAAGTSQGQIKLVNIARGEVVVTLEGHEEGESVEALTFVTLDLAGRGAPGGGLLVSGATDGKVKVWDTNTTKVRVQMSHENAITTLVSHPAPYSHLITSASADRTLHTWDVRNGEEVKVYNGHKSQINSAALGIGAGGKRILVSAGDEGVCKVWDV